MNRRKLSTIFLMSVFLLLLVKNSAFIDQPQLHTDNDCQELFHIHSYSSSHFQSEETQGNHTTKSRSCNEGKNFTQYILIKLPTVKIITFNSAKHSIVFRIHNYSPSPDIEPDKKPPKEDLV